MLRYVQRGSYGSQPIGELPSWFSSLLRARGILTEEQAADFLNPSLDQLHDPMRMQDMDKAVRLIEDAVNHGDSIVIYGDYDVDGVSATSIMLETLREMGARPAYRIPRRHSEGYGLNDKAVRELAANHQLLITVDCGITNHEEVRLARSLGMTVIVTDHHQPADTPSPADACLNPLLGDYPFRRLCGAGVALKLTQALLGMDAVLRRIDLAALATVADIVPLIDENRVIVTEGLRRMNSRNRIGLTALMDVSAVRGRPRSEDIAFRLAPRLNAGGRLEDASLGVALLTANDPEEATQLARHLHENNALRQNIERDITAQAEAAMAEQTDFLTDRAIIVMGNGWNSGVIGLCAGRLCEKYHFPVIVLSDNDGVAVGSCRSIPGVNIHAMLSSCKDLFLRFGGHEQAAGLTMEAKLVPELRRRLNLAIEAHCDPACYIPTAEYDMTLPLSEVNLGLIHRLDQLEPTGYGNPAPVFLASGAHIQQARRVGVDGKHLQLRLLDGQTIVKGVMFGGGDLGDRGYDVVDALFVPVVNEFKGQTSAEIQVRRLNPAEGTAQVAPEERILLSLMQELTALVENNGTIPPATVQTITEAVLKKHMAGGRGTLVLTHDAQRAARLVAEAGADSIFEEVWDKRGFNTVLTGVKLDRLRDQWQRIVLADGVALPGEAEAIHQCCPRAELLALKPGEHWLSLWQAMQSLTIEQLRTLYRCIRADMASSLAELMEASGLSLAQLLLGLTALEQTNLVTWALEPWQLQPLPPVKCNPMEAPVMRAVHMNAT